MKREILINRICARARKSIIGYSSFLRVPRLYHLISPIIYGRKCFILGSAPSPSLRLFDKDSILVCVNGSASNAKRLGLPLPSLTVIDFELLDPTINQAKASRSVIIANKLLGGLDLGILVASQSNNSNGGDPHILHALYSNYLRIYSADCQRITASVSQSSLFERSLDGLLSRGVFAIALCAWAGAKSISFDGFSLFKSRAALGSGSYFYGQIVGLDCSQSEFPVEHNHSEGPIDLDTRNHSLADCAMIASLVINGFRVNTDLPDFLPVIQNWGSSSMPRQ